MFLHTARASNLLSSHQDKFAELSASPRLLFMAHHSGKDRVESKRSTNEKP